ncbi:Transposon TX1 uncharacterized protein [Merluccius polli]|uniref:Transposon TX1 uncharacterized protein n=1 Tax=Merluccius polli TaxID=89951 RepID=A0AA47NBL4_MERPO|nr:Transposon TX1 uncharacterized protein [Merluccius polli]
MKDLETQVVELQTLADSTANQGLLDSLKSKKSAIANLLGVSAQGALVRSRFMNITQMDAPSRFFFGLERKNGQRKTIYSLRTGSGSEVSDSSEIRKCAVEFYRNLFKSEWTHNPDVHSSFLSGLPQVSEADNSELAAEVTLQELHTATMSLQSGRAPGMDGLPADFYKSFTRQGFNGLGHDFNLFLMNIPNMSTSSLPAFYKSVFRVWNLLRKERRGQVDSLYWILQEPVLWGTRLDLPSWAGQDLATRLQTAGVVTLGQVVALTGPRMDDPCGLAARLGLTSVRVTQRLLEHWKQRLTGHDRLLLNSSFNQKVTDDDPFPAIFLAPDFKDCSGILMECTHLAPLDGTTGKLFYRILMKAINRTKLNKRPDTPWRRYLQLAPAARPEWRSFYKPPLSKKHADIHWRVLHGVIAVNSFVSTINPAVEDKCPYCDQRETVFHCFVSSSFTLVSVFTNCFYQMWRGFYQAVFYSGF